MRKYYKTTNNCCKLSLGKLLIYEWRIWSEHHYSKFRKANGAYPLILKTIEPGKKVLIDLEVGAYTKELGAEEKKE